MPISPAYEWSETTSSVTITANCRGATAASTNVYSSPHYVSANAPPYFLEVDLHGAIDSTRSVATVRNGVVSLKLTKAKDELWGRLVVDLPRAERMKRREASRALAAQEAEAQLERKKRAVWDDSRFTLGKQMDKDRALRERIESLKAQELAAERSALDDHTWTEARAGGKAPEGRKGDSKGRSGGGAAALASSFDGLTMGESRIEEVPPLAAEDAGVIFDEEYDDNDDEAVEATGGGAPPSSPAKAPREGSAPAKPSTAVTKPAPPAPPALPPPRSVAKLKVEFTKQLLTAPARTKNAELAGQDLPPDPLQAPILIKTSGSEGDISQRDPAWLKDRGDRFFRMGDYRSAEEAYSMVLKQFASSIMGQAIDCVVGTWSNRAACRIQSKRFLEAADDCGHALSTMAKARCVTEYPKSEQAHVRCRMRLLTRRGAALANAGVLHRALTDLRVALTLCEGPMPSDAADRQMISSDIQTLVERHEEMLGKASKADEILAKAQPAAARTLGGPASGDDALTVPPASADALRQALALYDEAIELVPLDVPTLANRAACSLYLGEPSACARDCTTALRELDMDAERAKTIESEQSGMFAMPVPPKEMTELTDAQLAKEPTLRFELLRRRGSAYVDEGEATYRQAAVDLKEALKLRPGEQSIVMMLDDLSRRAAAANVDLDPLPPTMPAGSQLALTDGGEEDDDADDDESDADDEGPADEAAAADGADGAAAAGSASAAAANPSSSKPPVGTRSATSLKADADGAFREARLGKAVTLYGKALKADAQAEWMGEGRGILFRCQCLANRSACHLKLSSFTDTVDDAGAAIAALGTGLVGGEQTAEAQSLLLKLLARRGMALCQLTRYAEAAADYARAVELDPENEQLRNDLRLIEAAQAP